MSRRRLTPLHRKPLIGDFISLSSWQNSHRVVDVNSCEVFIYVESASGEFTEDNVLEYALHLPWLIDKSKTLYDILNDVPTTSNPSTQP